MMKCYGVPIFRGKHLTDGWIEYHQSSADSPHRSPLQVVIKFHSNMNIYGLLKPHLAISHGSYEFYVANDLYNNLREALKEESATEHIRQIKNVMEQGTTAAEMIEHIRVIVKEVD